MQNVIQEGKGIIYYVDYTKDIYTNWYCFLFCFDISFLKEKGACIKIHFVVAGSRFDYAGF